MRIYTGAAVSLVFFMGVAWFAGRFLNLEGPMFAIFFALMATLGLTASAFFVWMQSKHDARKAAKDEAAAGGGAGTGGGAPAAAGNGEVDGVVSAADKRLAGSQLAQGCTISNLPVVFLLGEPGSAKTSTMVASGLEPELLAGNVYQDNSIAPTRGVNLWFARQAVFVEPGGQFMSDQSTWVSLVKRLAPGKLKSVVGARSQSPRAAILCFDCEEFTKPGAADAITAGARKFQTRLGELSQTRGISFPVDVLFTRIDRVPFLLDFDCTGTRLDGWLREWVVMPVNYH
jgi:type VI secretion system protein ImpL